MSKAKTFSTKELAGTRVVGGKKGTRRIGKVQHFVFHPTERRCVGFIVKRPDLLWMFHRKDLFVPLDGFDMEDGRIRLPYKQKDMVDKGACKRLGINWDSCVFWEGMPILTQSGEECGIVGEVVFQFPAGKIESVTISRGATSKLLLGETVVPIDMVRGFRIGIGCELVPMGKEGEEREDALLGAILVSDDVLQIGAEGGLAEKAGQDAAIMQDKARRMKEKAKPKVDAAARKTEEVVNKGAYATGKQIGKTKGMFSSFKEEYRKAATGDDQTPSKRR
jgi:sporulation protein YlmC with PRC-barrel domain